LKSIEIVFLSPIERLRAFDASLLLYLVDSLFMAIIPLTMLVLGLFKTHDVVVAPFDI
jgi:hypothetical protein